MSSFCVFGESMENCKRIAKKESEEKFRNPSSEDCVYFVKERTREIFEESKKSVQISPTFDAPKFAMEWIELAKKTSQIKNPVVMGREKKVDRDGIPIIKKGKNVMAWVEYKFK